MTVGGSGWRRARLLATLHVVTSVRRRRLGRVGVGLGTAGALAWLARTRAAVVRAVLIRVAEVLEDVVRLFQIAVLRLFRRSTEPLLIPFVGHGSPRRVELGARAVLGLSLIHI